MANFNGPPVECNGKGRQEWLSFAFRDPITDGIRHGWDV
jgi:hypothetical protein